MYKHILIPTDGSDLSKKAIQHGVALAKALKARVTGLTITPPYHVLAVEPTMVTDTPEEYKRHMAELAARYLDQVQTAALAEGESCDCNVLHVEHDHPYLAIIDTANAEHCDLIVMASHGRRGISAIVLGSETVKVLTHSTIPVLVYR
jgi:nucleotide-binding universal stress UspA family protein